PTTSPTTAIPHIRFSSRESPDHLVMLLPPTRKIVPDITAVHCHRAHRLKKGS
ncbi:hypothetical protein ACLOJK_008123, partial [Asimina triloba]